MDDTQQIGTPDVSSLTVTSTNRWRDLPDGSQRLDSPYAAAQEHYWDEWADNYGKDYSATREAATRAGEITDYIDRDLYQSAAQEADRDGRDPWETGYEMTSDERAGLEDYIEATRQSAPYGAAGPIRGSELLHEGVRGAERGD